jgi:CSLREA domain-containing protein
MTQMSINYSLVVLNDQGRSTSLNLSHSTDDTTYLADTSANYTSTAAADTNPGYGLVFRNAIVTGLNVPPGGFFYLRWTTNDVGGSGSRDELGLGTINLTAGFTHTAQVVTKTADTNDGVCDADCSLREAVGVAFDDDTIVFSPLFTSPQTIVLSSGTEIATSRNVSVIGPGASLLTIDGGPGTNRIFSMSGIDSISGMTLTGGNGGGGNGGAVRSGAMLNITGVNFTGNSAANGGALDLSRGDVVNCSFSSNAASGAGGALYHDAMFGGDIRMINDTVVNNSASRGGGIAFENQNIGNSTSSTAQLWNLTVTSNLASSSGGGISLVDNSFSLPGVSGWLTSSIVAGNSAPAGPEIAVSGSAGFTSNGYNLLGDGPGDSASIGIFFQPTDLRDIDPGLGPLMLNGGETPTRDLLVSSPARDNGRADGLSADQRGSTRPVDNIFLAAATNGDNSDIGAVESSVLTVAIQGRVMSTSGRGVRNARVTLTYPNGSVITAVTGPRGFYRFDAALLAPSYNITVASRRFLFDPWSVSISDNLANCNITARS